MTTPEPAGATVCPTCAETIKAAARRCPYCQSPTGRWPLTRQEAGPLAVAVILVATLIGAGIFVDSRVTSPHSRPFPPFREQVEVVRLSLDPTGHHGRHAVMGFVTNRSAYAWRLREVELRFLNPNGSLLEARNVALTESPVVRPAGEAAFRAEVGRLPAAIATARLAARVYHASDGDRPADPD